MILPTIDLKTKSITFDDRLQQVRIIKRTRQSRKSASCFNGNWPTGEILFLNYKDDDGFYYVKKYREDWANIIKI